MRTNKKEVQTKVIEHIKEYYTIEELKANNEGIKDNYNTSDYQALKRQVEGGNFLIYTGDIINFLDSLNINEKNKKFTEEQSWELYKHLIALNGEKLVK